MYALAGKRAVINHPLMLINFCPGRHPVLVATPTSSRCSASADTLSGPRYLWTSSDPRSSHRLGLPGSSNGTWMESNERHARQRTHLIDADLRVMARGECPALRRSYSVRGVRE